MDEVKEIEDHLVAKQRLGDVLGLTYEERAAMGLMNLPKNGVSRSASIGEDFVTFLETEASGSSQRIEFNAEDEK